MASSPPPLIDGDAKPAVTREIAAEAAVWVTRLHGPSRSRQMELECLAWQASSAAHRLAFERCTDTWESVAGITVADVFAGSKPDPGDHGQGSWAGIRPWVLALGLASFLVAGIMGYRSWSNMGVYATDVGEQLTVLLDDGTRLSLNTGSKVKVDLGDRRRSVRVDGGEALFEVAKDPARPFVVQAAGNEVTATGTSFLVRYPDKADATGSVVVTLLEGSVTVQGSAWQGGGAYPPVTMVPGKQLRVGTTVGTRPSEVKLERSALDQAVAWKRNEAVFDNTSLVEAVSEMNRYSRTPIVLLDGLPGSSKRVSGVFRTGDSDGFARAIAAIHGLQLRERKGQLQLSSSS